MCCFLWYIFLHPNPVAIFCPFSSYDKMSFVCICEFGRILFYYILFYASSAVTQIPPCRRMLGSNPLWLSHWYFDALTTGLDLIHWECLNMYDNKKESHKELYSLLQYVQPILPFLCTLSNTASSSASPILLCQSWHWQSKASNH